MALNPFQLTELFGKQALESAASKLTVRGAKGYAATYSPDAAEELDYLDLTNVFDRNAVGMNVNMIVPAKMGSAPELFVTMNLGLGDFKTPLLQVGTFFEVENPVLRFAMDMVLDPFNLASFGTLGAGAKVGGSLVRGAAALGKGGRAARVAGKVVGGVGRTLEANRFLSGVTIEGRRGRLINAITDMGAVRSGADVVRRLIESIEMAGKVIGSGAREAVIAAAREGNVRAVNKLFKQALKTDKLDDASRLLLQQLRRDKHAVGEALTNATRLSELELTSGSFLQSTIREQVGANQINDLIKFGKVTGKSPVTNKFSPLTLTRQLLGFHMRGESFFVPAGKSIAKGLDNFITPGFRLTEDLRVGKLLDDIDSIQLRKAGDPTAFDFMGGLEPLRMLNSGPRDRILQMVGKADVNEADMFKLWKASEGLGRKTTIDKLGDEARRRFDKFVNTNIKDANAELRVAFQEFERLRVASLDSAIGRLKESASSQKAAARPFGPSSPQLDELAAEAMNAIDKNAEMGAERLARIYDLYSLNGLKTDAYGFGSSIAGRANLGTLLAGNSAATAAEIFKIKYKKFGREVPDFVGELMGRWRENKDLFKLSNGRLHLADNITVETLRKRAVEVFDPLTGKAKLGKKMKSADFLADLFSRDSKGALNRLLDEGLDEETVLMFKYMDDTLTDIGKNLVDNEFILETLLSDYLPRIFKPNRRFFGLLKGSRRQMNEVGAAILSGDEKFAGMSDIVKEFSAEKELFLAGKQGAPSFTRLRRLSESIAIRMEQLGLGVFERNGVAQFTQYMDSVNKSLILGQLVRDLPSISPKLTSSVIGKDAALFSSDQLKDLRVVMHPDQVPAAVKARLYTAIDMIPRREGFLQIGERAVPTTKRAALDVAARRLAGKASSARGAGVKTALRKFAGKSEVLVDGEKVAVTVGVAVKKKAKILGKWIRTGVYPDTVDPRIRDAIESVISKRAEEVSSKLGQVKLTGTGKMQNQILVFNGHSNAIQEAFRLFKQTGEVGSLTRFIDDGIRVSKSIVLMGDIFHYNTLAINQIVSDPAQFLRILKDDAGRFLPGARNGVTDGVRGLRPVVGGAIGSVVGGVSAGAASGGDENAILGGSLAGALYGAMIGAARVNAIQSRRMMMNPENMDSLIWMGLGGWQGKPDDRSIGLISNWITNLSSNLARRGSIFTNPVTGLAHVAEAWDQEMWEMLQNGSKHAFFSHFWANEISILEKSSEFSTKALLKEFDASKAAGDIEAGIKGVSGEAKRLLRTPGFDDLLRADPLLVPSGAGIDPRARAFIAERRLALKTGVARDIVQISNDVFGGQAMRNLLAQPDYQFGMRKILLAPDWTLSRLHMASAMFMGMNGFSRAALGAGAGAVMQASEQGWEEGSLAWGLAGGAALGFFGGKWATWTAEQMASNGSVMRKLAQRRTAAAITAGYTFSNLMNFSFTGHYMWDNEEGKKLSIQLPGRDDQGRLRYVSLGKPVKEAFEVVGAIERDKFPLPGFSRLKSKLNVPARFFFGLLNNDNGYGPIANPEDGDEPWDVGYSLIQLTSKTMVPIIAGGPFRAAEGLILGALTGEPAGTSPGEAGLRFAGFSVSKSRPGISNVAAGGRLRSSAVSSLLRDAGFVPNIGRDRPFISP